MKRLFEVFWVSLKLGLTSFGGPVAHLGYFHHEYVRRRKWLDDQSYADLVALCQFLPGPASSQVGIGIGTMRAGLVGGVVAWIGFTLPSVLALILFALFLQGDALGDVGWIHGLKLVAVAIVAHAIIGMGQKLAPDRGRATIVILALAVALLWPSSITQISIIIVAGLIGLLLFKKEQAEMKHESAVIPTPIHPTIAIISLLLFFSLLLILPWLRDLHQGIALFDSFYRAGALVFGGGHVVLPLLQAEMVPTGWISEEIFLAGYATTQAVPGPLFTFAAYLGTIINGWGGALLATVAIFLPAFLLVIGMLPFWDQLRKRAPVRRALMGINAAVIGILIAAFYHPIWTSAIFSPWDFVIVAILYGMLAFWKLPPWTIVVTGALAGTILI